LLIEEKPSSCSPSAGAAQADLNAKKDDGRDGISKAGGRSGDVDGV
jgi:hypothetical protein